MANPSMDGDVVAWLRQQLQEAHPDLLREMLATMAQELMGAEAQALCGGISSGRAFTRASQEIMAVISRALPPQSVGEEEEDSGSTG